MQEVRLHGSNRYDSREGGGRTASGTAVESRVWNRDRERLRTNIGHIRVDSREGIGRVESGTETEKTSGTSFPDKAE